MKYRIKAGRYNEKCFTKENRDVFIKKYDSMEELISASTLLEEYNAFIDGDDMVFIHERLTDDFEWVSIYE